MVKWGNRTNYITLHDVIAELPSVGMILRNLWSDSKSFRLINSSIPPGPRSNPISKSVQSTRQKHSIRSVPKCQKTPACPLRIFFLPQKCVPLGCVVINSSHATLWRRVSPLDKNSKAKREKKNKSREKLVHFIPTRWTLWQVQDRIQSVGLAFGLYASNRELINDAHIKWVPGPTNSKTPRRTNENPSLFSPSPCRMHMYIAWQ